jgi:hypothetical protein
MHSKSHGVKAESRPLTGCGTLVGTSGRAVRFPRPRGELAGNTSDWPAVPPLSTASAASPSTSIAEWPLRMPGCIGWS